MFGIPNAVSVPTGICKRMDDYVLPAEVLTEIERNRQELYGEPVLAADPESGPCLDSILATRSHIRLLRVLALHGDHINLTGRDLAARARVSNGRTVEVLRTLVQARVVTRYRESSWAIYELNDDSPVVKALRALFASERDLTPV